MTKETKDLLIEPIEKGNVKITAQTDKAKKIFKEGGAGNEDYIIGKQKHISKLIGWAVSHNLSVDSKVELTIPEIPRLDREDLKKVWPNTPESFLPRQLFAKGYAKFKGTSALFKELNEQFDKGEEYPIYEHEGLSIAIGKDGKGYKFVSGAWSKITKY